MWTFLLSIASENESVSLVTGNEQFDVLNLFSLYWWSSHFVQAYAEEPFHVVLEITCFIVIVYLLFSRPYDLQSEKLSKKEEDELIKEWEPEPLVPVNWTDGIQDRRHVIVEGETGPYVEAIVNGKSTTLLNFASYNFLDLAHSKTIKDAAKECIEKYGVGSCGPRGFYGTIDPHVQVEEAIAKFMGVKEAILYSDSIACISSVIPAFAKKGDLIIADESINFSIQQGVFLSRSNVLYYKHNDVEDLKRILDTVKERDMRRTGKLNRRFIVTEGISQYRGDICPLADIVRLKNQYKYRVILDDSLAIGVLGATGRGSAEYWNVPIEEVDILAANMDCSLATVGGFCIGSHEVVDHQRLSGAGYCFSASSPPFTATAGVISLDLIDKDAKLCARVRSQASYAYEQLKKLPGVVIEGAESSPVIHVRLDAKSNALALSTGDESVPLRYFQSVSNFLLDHDIMVPCPTYIPYDNQTPPPGLRILITAGHNKKDIDAMVKTLKQGLKDIQFA